MRLHKLLPLLFILCAVVFTLWLSGYSSIDWLEDQKRSEAFSLFANNYWSVGNTDAIGCWSVPVHRLLMLKALIIALVTSLFAYVFLLFSKRSVYWSLVIFAISLCLYWLFEKIQFCQNWMDLI